MVLRAILSFIFLSLGLISFVGLIKVYKPQAKTIIWAPLICGLFTFSYVELLSLFSLVNPVALSMPIWFVILYVALYIKRFPAFFKSIYIYMKRLVSMFYRGISYFSTWQNVIVVSVIFIGIFVILFIAFWGPPNNWDSMTYHLPRIMHWLQNGSVNYYPAITQRQLTTPNLGEYFVMFTIAFSGGDYLANLVQTSSFLLSLVLVGAIAYALNKKKNVAILSVVFATFTPIAMAEATTTQIDLIATLWVLIGIYIVVLFGTHSIQFVEFAIALSAVLVLSAATKPTALVMLLAPLILVTFVLVTRYPREGIAKVFNRIMILVGLSITAVMLGLLPQSVRNYFWLGTFLDSSMGTASNERLIPAHIGLDVSFGNFLRYAINNVGIPEVVPSYISDWITVAAVNLSGYFGIAWSDSAAVSFGHLAKVGFGRSEDDASNPFQFFLGLLAVLLVVFFLRSKFRQYPLVVPLGITYLGMMISLLSFFTWNVWTNRFIIPVLLLGSIFVAILLDYLITNAGARRAVIRNVAFGLLIVNAVYGMAFISTTYSRPLLPSESFVSVPREGRYFSKLYSQVAEGYKKVALKLKQLPDGSVVALQLSSDAWEYPLWALANMDNRLKFVVIGSDSEDVDFTSVDATVCFPSCTGQTLGKNVFNIGEYVPGT